MPIFLLLIYCLPDLINNNDFDKAVVQNLINYFLLLKYVW